MIFTKLFKKNGTESAPSASLPICTCGHRASERLKNGSFWCPFCSKEFAGQAPTSCSWPCQICGKEFKSVQKFGKHFQKKHLKDFS